VANEQLHTMAGVTSRYDLFRETKIYFAPTQVDESGIRDESFLLYLPCSVSVRIWITSGRSSMNIDRDGVGLVLLRSGYPPFPYGDQFDSLRSIFVALRLEAVQIGVFSEHYETSRNIDRFATLRDPVGVASFVDRRFEALCIL